MARREVNIRQTPDGGYQIQYRKKPHGWTVFLCLLAGLLFVGWTGSAWAMVPWLVVIFIMWMAWRHEDSEAMKPQNKEDM